MNFNLEMMRRKQDQHEPYEWWFESHNTSLACSPWLHSTLSELNEKTHTMLNMIEEDADTFTERVEMYYEKRPQLINIVEDFYRTQRSLLEQIDHLRNNPHFCTHNGHMSTSHACSCKSCEDIDDDVSSDVCHEDDEGHHLVEDLEKLKQDNMVKDKAIEGLERRVIEYKDEVFELMQEIGRLRVENEALGRQVLMDEIRCDEMKNLEEELGLVRVKSEEQCELLKMKDEEKREVIRQLSVAVELLKDENVFLKKRFARIRAERRV